MIMIKKGDELLREIEAEKGISRQGKGGGGPAGNQKALKLKTPELKEEAYRQYCEHLARGKSKESWYFEHPEVSLTWETMEKYIKNEVEFDPIKKKIAEAKGFGMWEEVLEQSAKGKNPKANTATLQMLMRNKYGWDKNERRDNEATEVQHEYYSAVMSQLNNLQSQRKSAEIKVSIDNAS